MSPESRGIRAGLAALGAALTLVAGACGEDEQPLRIGVVVDCVGINRSFQDAELSGAQLPLIERGARPGGREARRRNHGCRGCRPAGRARDRLHGGE